MSSEGEKENWEQREWSDEVRHKVQHIRKEKAYIHTRYMNDEGLRFMQAFVN